MSFQESNPLHQELIDLSKPDYPTETLAETLENHDQIEHVDQAHWKAAALGRIRWLTTFGANPCFIVSIYDFTNLRGALTHLDSLNAPMETVWNMQEALSYPRPEQRSKYGITLVGGNMSDLDDMGEILTAFKDLKENRKLDVELIVGDIRQHRASLALDLSDGSVKRFIPHKTLTNFKSTDLLEYQSRALEASMLGKRQSARGLVIGF